MPSSPRSTPFTGLARLLLLTLLAPSIACSNDEPSGPDGPDLPTSGTFSATVVTGGSATATFVAGRAGTTNVAICGPTGTNFDLVVGSKASASPSNCERVIFNSVAGQTYTVSVTAVAGTGVLNGCWANTQFLCQIVEPAPGTDNPAVPAGYYMAAEGLGGAALIQALHDIVDGHESFDYTSARDSLYAIIDDWNDDDRITDLYVGRTEAVSSRATAAAVNFNTEHLWPRSFGADIATPAGTDLHILWTADETANSQRLNHPFGEVVGTAVWTSPAVSGQAERSRLGADGAGRTVFEPRPSVRGDVARALLYFYVRYRPEPTSTFSLGNFNVEEQTLIRWARLDPPDAVERARHERVYRVQGNRNPFVDRPQFLASIGDFPNQ